MQNTATTFSFTHLHLLKNFNITQQKAKEQTTELDEKVVKHWHSPMNNLLMIHKTRNHIAYRSSK